MNSVHRGVGVAGDYSGKNLPKTWAAWREKAARKSVTKRTGVCSSRICFSYSNRNIKLEKYQEFSKFMYKKMKENFLILVLKSYVRFPDYRYEKLSVHVSIYAYRTWFLSAQAIKLNFFLLRNALPKDSCVSLNRCKSSV